MKFKPSFNALKKQLLVSSVFALASSTATFTHAAVIDDADTAASSIQASSNGLTNRIIIKMEDSASTAGLSILAADTDAAVETRMSKRAKRKMKRLRKMYNGAHVMKLDEAATELEIAEILENLEADPSISYAVVDRVMQPMFTPNDEYYTYQWHYYETTGGLNLPDAWDIATGAGVVVAVLDTGIVSHTDLNANILGGYDMISDASVGSDGDGRDSDPTDPGDFCADRGTTNSWHGTHVAGTIAAVTNNGTGVAGVAFNADVLAVRVLGTCGGYNSDIADGIVWAAGGNVSGVPTNPYPAQVLNLSLGGGGACDSVSQSAINTARSLGATVVVATGNSNINVANASPANCSGVIAVGATDRAGARAVYSNYGSLVDISAPGGEVRSDQYDGVLSTLNTGTYSTGTQNYEFSSGTSMATPHVAGAAALMYSIDPNITPDEVESILKNTARSFPGGCTVCGEGIVDATAAVEATLSAMGSSSDANLLSESNLSGSEASWQYYTVQLPAGYSTLNAEIIGSSGDADLYVRYGSAPTASDYDCRPWLGGSSEECTFSSPRAGTYYIGIYGYSAYSGLSLDVSVE